MKYVRLIGSLLLAGAVPSVAEAHHSFAMFDANKEVSLSGTVKDFQWTNPHSWIQLVVQAPGSGKSIEYSIEMPSPNVLARTGWRHTSLKAGDRAIVIFHPMKDGSPGGSIITASVNGVQIGTRQN